MKASKKQHKVIDEAAGGQQIVISPPQMKIVAFKIRGDAPLVMNRMSQKVKDAWIAGQEKGDQKKKDKKKKVKRIK